LAESVRIDVLKSRNLAQHTQDDAFREIQLNGKQLVFLFMVATVVSVVIFLCGVFVGRGVRAERAPLVRFLSNKRGYAATFGRDLLSAGFDPRDVMDKTELTTIGVPAIAALFDRQFPLSLNMRSGASQTRRRVADADRQDVEQALDVVLWPTSQGMELGGGLVDGRDKRFAFRAGSHEADTWRALIDDRMSSGTGVAVLSVSTWPGVADSL